MLKAKLRKRANTPGLVRESRFDVVQNPPFLGYTRRAETAGL